MQYFVRFLSPGSAETDNGRGGKLNSHLMASCIRNICTKTYHKLDHFFKLWWKNFGVFYASQCTCIAYAGKVNISLNQLVQIFQNPF